MIPCWSARLVEFLYVFKKGLRQAIAEGERAVALNPGATDFP